jgi:hypothetical protein
VARKPQVSKLFNLKEWLTLYDAARHLSIVFGEEVTQADVLRLALDKRLTLSVDFVNHANARKGKLIPIEQCKFRILPSLAVDKSKIPLDLPLNAISRADLDKLALNIRNALDAGELILVGEDMRYRDSEFLALDGAVESISGVWDLPMVGAEVLDVDHRYQTETGGPSVTLVNIEGAFVERDDVVCQLQADFDDNEYEAGSKISGERLEQRIREENLPKKRADELRAHFKTLRQQLKERWKRKLSSRYYPAASLPTDAVYVVRTASLRAFEQSVLDNPSSSNDRPLGRREETTLLNIAGGLLGLLLGKSPGGKPHSVFKSQAAIIDALVATYPGRPGMSKRTLEEKLALARRFLDTDLDT